MTMYEKPDHQIFHGDAIDVLTDCVEDSSVDLIFADPPYNIGKVFNGNKEKWESEEKFLCWSYRWIDLCLRKLKPNGAMYFMASTQAMPFFDIYLRSKITILSRIVWNYDSSGVQAKKYFGSMYEPILFCVKNPKLYTFNANEILVEAKTGAKRGLIDYRKSVPAPYNTQKVPGNVWQFPRVRYRMEEYEDHPTQKPTALLERIIRASSNSGDLVLDPFSGTFTTCVVAEMLGRRSCGIEIEKEYVNIGLRRLCIQSTLEGENLDKPAKSYERKNSLAGTTNATSIHQNHS